MKAAGSDSDISEINDSGVLTLNGKRLVIRGVDRHDFCPESGRYVTKAYMRKRNCCHETVKL